MASILLLPDPAGLALVGVEVHQETRMITATVLARWCKEARDSGIPELCSLAAGIYRDYDAVYGALETVYSNGQTEAQVHRLKLIKRQAYGRASFDLFRLQALHGSGVTYEEQVQLEQMHHQKCV